MGNGKLSFYVNILEITQVGLTIMQMIRKIKDGSYQKQII